MKTWHHILLGILIGILFSAVLFLVVIPPHGSSIELLPAPTAAPIIIQIDGAVQKPGIYSLTRDSRVNAAIDAAGGFLESANTDVVNLAARLKDGEKISIPVKGTPGIPSLGLSPEKASSVSEATLTGPVELNTATIDELQTLPGIGPSKAQQIIDYRDAHHGFKSIDEIIDVPGIGETTFERMKDLITVQ